MNAKVKAILVSALVILLVCVCVLPWWQEKSKFRQANVIQVSLEKYRQDNGRYPESLGLIGIKEQEEGPIYYQRNTESSYELWFGKSLGESMTFRINEGRWR